LRRVVNANHPLFVAPESTPQKDLSMTVLSATETNSSLPIADLTNQDSRPHGGACCTVSGCLVRRTIWGAAVLMVILATLAIGYLLGTTTKVSSKTNWQIPPMIDATAAVSGEKYSMATGPAGDDAEGLFVLDHNSGLLQCSVIYPRLGQFLALFTVNVSEALGEGAKGGSFLMVTGNVDFPRASNRAIGGNVLVYVLNTATGNYAAYGVPFDRTAATAGRTQQGTLVLMGSGQANPAPRRDAP